MFRMALRHIRWRLFESALIILAVGLGVAVVASALGILEAQRVQTRRFLDSPMFRTIQVMPGGMTGFGFIGGEDMAAHPVGKVIEKPVQLTLKDLDGLRKCCPDVKHVFTVNYSSFPLSSEPERPPPDFASMTEEQRQRFFMEMERRQLHLVATTPDFFGFNELKAAQGNLFVDADVRKGSPVVVLGADLAKRLFPDGAAVGKPLRAGPLNLTVIGVLAPTKKDKGRNEPDFGPFGPGGLDDQAVAPMTALNQGAMFGGGMGMGGGVAVALPGGPPSGEGPPLGAAPGAVWDMPVNEISVAPADSRRMREAIRQVNTYLRGRYGEAVTARSQLEDFQRAEKEQRKHAFVMAAFASAALVIAALNILQLMLARVMRRTRQVGIAASLGAGRAVIFRQFLAEALLLGLIGTAVGLALTPLGGRLLASIMMGEMGDGKPPPEVRFFVLDARVLAIGLGLALGITLLFGVFPARQAARVNPADALRSD